MHIKDSTVLSMEIFGALAEEDSRNVQTRKKTKQMTGTEELFHRDETYF